MLVLLVGVFSVAAFFSETLPPPDPARLWGLVIGISNYTHAEPLRYAASDADSVSRFLSSPRGGSIPPDHLLTLLEDRATRRGIEVELELMQERVEAGDTVYIYVAGHGFINRRGLGYFIPSDGDLRVPASTSVSFSVLKELVDLGLAHAERRILFSDLCNAGRIGPERSALAEKIQNLINAELLKLGGGRPGSFLNLLASRPTEASWESDDLAQGVFTHTLLKALNGEGGSPDNTVVTAGEVVDFVCKEVPKYTGFQQNPMANDSYDPAQPLSFLDLPGPAPKVVESGTVLELVNLDESPFRRVQWIDPQTQSMAVRQLPRETGSLRLESLLAGELQLRFYDAENQEHPITVTLQPGQNTLDLATVKSGQRSWPALEPFQVAMLSPKPLFLHPLPLPAQTPQLSSVVASSTLLVRLETGTGVYVDGDYFGKSAGTDRFLQLQGLLPGSHNLRLVPSPEREHRFRLRLFPGPQIFDLVSGELRAVAEIHPPPERIPVPTTVPATSGDSYRSFIQALWEERLIEPEGGSAWDHYFQMEKDLPAGLRDGLKSRLIVAMGNRAQRTILKYLRGGDVRWTAAVFEQGGELTNRTQTLFKRTASYESQERFFNGRASIERGEYVQAVQELQQAIDLDSEASHAYNALGLALWKQNLLEQAMVPLQQAIELSPRWTYPRITLALIYLELRRYQEARDGFQTAIPGQLRRQHSLSRSWAALLTPGVVPAGRN